MPEPKWKGDFIRRAQPLPEQISPRWKDGEDYVIGEIYLIPRNKGGKPVQQFECCSCIYSVISAEKMNEHLYKQGSDCWTPHETEDGMHPRYNRAE